MTDLAFPPDPPRPPPDEIHIVYEGQAESIDVGKIGKALTGLGVLVKTFGADAKMREAKKDNSFSLEIGLSEAELFGSDVISVVNNELFGESGLIASINQIRGRKVLKVIPEGESASLRFEDDDEHLVLPKRTVALLYNSSVTESLRNVCSPLDPSDGVTGVSIRSNAGTHKLPHDRVSTYMAFSLPDTVHVQQQDFEADIVQAHFMGSQRWQLRIAGTPRPISVSIEDKGFMSRVDEGEKFAKGDRIRGVVEISHREGKRAEYKILSAEHIPIRQKELDF